MKNAVELLEIISASSLPLTDRLEEQRNSIITKLDEHLNAPKSSADAAADVISRVLVNDGVVMADLESVKDVVAEYLHVMDDEQSALGDEEMDFLENFLK